MEISGKVQHLLNIIQKESFFGAHKSFIDNRRGLTRIFLNEKLNVLKVEFFDVLFFSDYDFHDLTKKPFAPIDGMEQGTLYFEVVFSDNEIRHFSVKSNYKIEEKLLNKN